MCERWGDASDKMSVTGGATVPARQDNGEQKSHARKEGFCTSCAGAFFWRPNPVESGKAAKFHKNLIAFSSCFL